MEEIQESKVVTAQNYFGEFVKEAKKRPMMFCGIILWLLSFVWAFLYVIFNSVDSQFALNVLAIVTHIEGFIFILFGYFVYSKYIKK